MVQVDDPHVEVEAGAISFPEFEGEFHRTANASIDAALSELDGRKDEWASLAIDERIRILDEMMQAMVDVSEDWVSASLEFKNERRDSHGEGEEWASIWPIFRLVRIFRRALVDIQERGRPRIPGPVYEREDGQVVAEVFPQTVYDRLIYMSTVAEVWMQPDVTPEDLHEEQASQYRNLPSTGGVALVLGAGNIPYLPYAQSLYKLFGSLQVVILKLNPVTDYIGPAMEKALAPLIERGYLRMIYGGVHEGAYLTDHPMVEEIQLTGSDKTFEAIVFGTGDERERRKSRREPKLNKPIEAELGNVSPVIVVPGPWSENDLNYQATQLVTWLTFNSGYYCLTPRVLIQHRGWNQRRKLIDKMGDIFDELDTRMAWYPGSENIHGTFVAEHPEALQFGEAPEGYLPWTLISDLDPTRADEIAFSTEGFCSLMAETALEADGAADFLDRAAAFANDRLWGNLSSTIIVHPKSLKDPEVARALDKTIASLRYGTVYINDFTGFAACWAVTPWGPYPGNDIYDVQSGIGVINNALMLQRTQKTVIKAPFKRFPNPFLVSRSRFSRFGRELASFASEPGVGRLAKVFWSALRA